MSYKNIVRKCSVCQGCGMCDYEYEVEYLGEVSGEYNPMMAQLMNHKTKEQRQKEITDLLKNIAETDIAE